MASFSSALNPKMSLPPIPPDPPDLSHHKLDHESVDDLGLDKGINYVNDPGMANDPLVDNLGPAFPKHNAKPVSPSTVVTYDPFEGPNFNGDETILRIECLPLHWNYESIYHEFSVFGCVKEIRLRLAENSNSWQVWVFFSTHGEALNAFTKTSKKKSECQLVNKAPSNLDRYHPQVEDRNSVCLNVSRSPLPAMWLIVTTKEERTNLYNFRKLVRIKAGDLGNSNITRFGRNSFLVHAKSAAQATMLLNLRIDPDSVIKEIKPHYNFSYAKGVIFSRDLYELPDDEILDMCSENVWKIQKIPRSTMIVITFYNETLESHIVVDRERIPVRPYKQRPLQCYNCFGYGHASGRCTQNKVCGNCSQYDHGECE